MGPATLVLKLQQTAFCDKYYVIQSWLRCETPTGICQPLDDYGFRHLPSSSPSTHHLLERAVHQKVIDLDQSDPTASNDEVTTGFTLV